MHDICYSGGTISITQHYQLPAILEGER